MEKQILDNKAPMSHLEQARQHHKTQMASALKLADNIQDPKMRATEYRKLSKISFKYYLKPKAQVELENSIKVIKEATKYSEPSETK